MIDLPDTPGEPSPKAGADGPGATDARSSAKIPQLTAKEREATRRFLAAVAGPWPADPLQERMQSSRR